MYTNETYYLLPAGLTWAMVAESRKRWDIDPSYAPLAVAPGVVAWGRLLAGDYRVFFADFYEDDA